MNKLFLFGLLCAPAMYGMSRTYDAALPVMNKIWEDKALMEIRDQYRPVCKFGRGFCDLKLTKHQKRLRTKLEKQYDQRLKEMFGRKGAKFWSGYWLNKFH